MVVYACFFCFYFGVHVASGEMDRWCWIEYLLILYKFFIQDQFTLYYKLSIHSSIAFTLPSAFLRCQIVIFLLVFPAYCSLIAISGWCLLDFFFVWLCVPQIKYLYLCNISIYCSFVSCFIVCLFVFFFNYYFSLSLIILFNLICFVYVWVCVLVYIFF